MVILQWCSDMWTLHYLLYRSNSSTSNMSKHISKFSSAVAMTSYS